MESLKKNEEFRACYKQGRSYANKYLVIHLKKNDEIYNRIGISTSKKVGNSIVRHRIARLVRESYRLNEKFIKGGTGCTAVFDNGSNNNFTDSPDAHWDIAVVGRRSASSAGYKEIETSLLELFKAAGFYSGSETNEKSTDCDN